MSDDGKTLDVLRREIDEIDDKIHDLLIRRAAVVERIGAVKRGASRAFVRPAREANVLRRLAARHSGAFPAASVIQIWREMIAALTAIQGPFSIAVCQPEGGPDYRSMARAQFGAFTPITSLSHAGHVVAAVRDGTASVGVLPLPGEDDSAPWWRYILSDSPERIRVVSRLPSIKTDDSRSADHGALVIATVAFEDTSDDHSYLVFQSREHISRGRLQSALSEIGFTQYFYASWRDDQHPVAWNHIVEVDGYVDDGDAAIDRLMRGFEPRIDKVFALGGFPVPIDLSRAGGSEEVKT